MTHANVRNLTYNFIILLKNYDQVNFEISTCKVYLLSVNLNENLKNYKTQK